MRTLLTCLALLALCVAANAADLTGAWSFTVETDGGSGNPNFTFKQNGDQLTGTYKGQFGEAKVEGKVTGKSVEFWFELEQGDKIKVVYTGTLESDTAMKGKVSFGSLAQGTWSAKKN